MHTAGDKHVKVTHAVKTMISYENITLIYSFNITLPSGKEKAYFTD